MVLSNIKQLLISEAVKKSGENILPTGSCVRLGVMTLMDDKNYTVHTNSKGAPIISLWYDTPDGSSHLVKFEEKEVVDA